MIHTLLFDVDGVLADTEHLHQAALKQAAMEGGGYVVPDTDARTTVDKLAAAGVPADEIPSMYAYKRRLYERLMQEIPKDPALATALYRLYGKGLRLAACTNSNRQSTTSLLQHLGIFGVFSTIVTSSDVSLGKPAPDIYSSALKQLSTLPARAVVFEDSDVGIAAAKAAGVQNIIRCTTATLLKELEPWLS